MKNLPQRLSQAFLQFQGRGLRLKSVLRRSQVNSFIFGALNGRVLSGRGSGSRGAALDRPHGPRMLWSYSCVLICMEGRSPEKYAST